MKQRLETDEWFGNLTDELKDLYTDRAFLKTNQKEMFSKLKGVSRQMSALKAQLSNSTANDDLQR